MEARSNNARYRSPGDKRSPDLDRSHWREQLEQLPHLSLAGRHDLASRQYNWNLPPQKLDQHANAPSVIAPD